MSEHDDDFEDQESEGSEEQVKDNPDLRKLKNENRSLRQRLRRTEIVAKHGEEIAGLIPEALPLDEWEGYAEKLAAFRPEGPKPEAAEPQATPEPPKEEPSEQETKLAALNDGTSGGTTDQRTWTGQELIRASRAGNLTDDEVRRIVEEGRLRGHASEDPGVTLH